MLALLVTCLSFASGFARDLSIANVFGGSIASDSLFVALIIPTFIENIFGVALRDAVIPHLQSARNCSELSFEAEAGRIGRNLLMLGSGVTLLFILSPRWSLVLLVPGWSENVIASTIPMFRLGACSIAIIVWAYFQSALLNLKGYFVLPLWRSVLFNVGALTGIWAFTGSGKIVLLAMIIGQAMHLLLMQAVLGRQGFYVASGVTVQTPSRLGTHLLPLIGATMALQINVIAERFFASWLPAGSVSHLSYAYRLATVPLILFTFSVLGIVYTALVTCHADNNHNAWLNLLKRSLSLMMLVMVSSSAFIVSFAHPIVSMLLEHGEFKALDSENTAGMLLAYGLGLPAMAFSLVAGRALLSAGRSHYVFRAALWCAGTTLLFDVFLLQWLRGMGLAAAVSLGASVNAYVLSRAITAEFGKDLLKCLFLRWSTIGASLLALLVYWPWTNASGLFLAALASVIYCALCAKLSGDPSISIASLREMKV
jgi:murein biosynthesis integral membrane protein MurJ